MIIYKILANAPTVLEQAVVCQFRGENTELGGVSTHEGCGGPGKKDPVSM
jgi:hypothetical protein